ncbi:hypothetical protein J6590_030292 [Homalodisca vitripennis]|nr:hypothetical protein J6590_030292 [Homalodisca vitripennis]
MPGRSTRGFNSPQSLFVLYNTLVRPLLEYGSVVWSPYLLGHTEELHRVQARFVRMLGVRLGFTLKHQYHNWSRSFLFNLSISDVSSVIGLPAPTASSCGAYALVNARRPTSAAAGFLHRERKVIVERSNVTLKLSLHLTLVAGYRRPLQQLRGLCTGNASSNTQQPPTHTTQPKTNKQNPTHNNPPPTPTNQKPTNKTQHTTTPTHTHNQNQQTKPNTQQPHPPTKTTNNHKLALITLDVSSRLQQQQLRGFAPERTCERQCYIKALLHLTLVAGYTPLSSCGVCTRTHGTQLQQLRGFCTGERTFIVERNNVTLKLSLHLTLVEGYMSTVPAAAGLLHLQTLGYC